ncbi:hypothetical protein [Paraburkholderia youngii]|uniref:hypothetical protein n=1 Tax=Paraburkholderia youngii TaxID=2782701 RepID=UPI003D23F011
MQSGFDFGDLQAVRAIEVAAGTWEQNYERPSLGLPDFQAMAVNARAKLNTVPASAREYFDAGVQRFEAALGSLKNAVEVKRSDLSTLEEFEFEPEGPLAEAFTSLSRRHSGAATPADGVKWKVREQIDASYYAVRVEGVGTVILRKYFHHDTVSITYEPPSPLGRRCTDRFFLDSYADAAQSIELPHKLWGVAFAADKIAYAGKGKASVPTFRYGGREYVVTSRLSSIKNGSAYAIGTAWALCPISQWPGKSYSYQEHSKLLEDGRQERSDYRGIVVLVRGQEMVIESAMFVYDLNAEPQTYVLDAGETSMDEDHDPMLLDGHHEQADSEEAFA